MSNLSACDGPGCTMTTSNTEQWFEVTLPVTPILDDQGHRQYHDEYSQSHKDFHSEDCAMNYLLARKSS